MLNSIQAAFLNQGLPVTIVQKYFLVESTIETIVRVAENAKYVPVIRPEPLEGKIAFTVVPYRAPTIFHLENDTLLNYRTINADTEVRTKQKRYLPEDHYEISKAKIEDLLNENIQTAVILGPGNCLDIPLEKIVRQCQRVTLMEIDHQTLQETIDRLPQELRRKVVPIVSDLTGVLEYFQAKTKEIPNGIPFDLGAHYIIKIMKESDQNSSALPLPGKFDLVISSMVFSQLFYASYDFLGFEISKKVSKDSNTHNPILREKTNRQFDQFIMQMCQRHFLHMAQLTAPQGKIYWSDQIYDWRTSIVDGAIVEKKRTICTNFNLAWEMFPQPVEFVKKVGEWKWDNLLPETGEDGARMLVRAYEFNSRYTD